MKVYVGNLPFTITEKELTDLFSPYGELTEVTVIKDKFSGRSKGFGFVTFGDKAAGDTAVAELNGKEIDGRAIKVNEAKPMDPDRKPSRGGGGHGGGYGGGGGGSGGFKRRF